MSAAVSMPTEESAEVAADDDLAASIACMNRNRARWAAELAQMPAKTETPCGRAPTNGDVLAKIVGDSGGYEGRIAEFKRHHDEHAASCTADFCGRCSRHACVKCKIVAVADWDQHCRACALARAIRDVLPRRFAEAHVHPERIRSVAARTLTSIPSGNANRAYLGPAGSGKTSGMCAGVIALMDRAIVDGRRVPSITFASAIDLGRARSIHRLGDGEAETIVEAIGVELLLIDDIGAEAGRDSEALAQVIHARHDADSTTWLTTALSPDEIAARYGGGLERRIFEGAILIDCMGGPAPCGAHSP